MRAGLRSYVTAGVAVVGVSVIAVAPIAATPPDVRIPNTDVQLSANPFQEYVDALRRAIENAQLVLDDLFAEPVPIAQEWRLNGMLAGLLDDSEPNVEEFLETFGRNPASLNGTLELLAETLPGELETAAELLAVGNIQAAVNALLNYSSSLLALPALRIAVGPISSSLSASAAVAHEVLSALNSGDPQRVLGAVIAAPVVIANGILNGHSGFTGFLDTGGPVSALLNIGEVARAILTPRPDGLTITNRATTSERLLTLDLDAVPKLPQGLALSGPPAPVIEEKQPDLTVKQGEDADEGTNEGVMAVDGVTDQRGGNQHGPRSDGANSHSQNIGGAGLSTLREGISDGIEGFREGVRKAVKTVTGRGDDHDDSATDSADESP